WFRPGIIESDLARTAPLPRPAGGFEIPDGVKVVTYATRGMESMRGFDVFMRMAKVLCDRQRDVVFVVAGEDRVCYGGDDRFAGANTHLRPGAPCPPSPARTRGARTRSPRPTRGRHRPAPCAGPSSRRSDPRPTPCRCPVPRRKEGKRSPSPAPGPVRSRSGG